MSDPSFVVYIDESGDDGFRISEDVSKRMSSRWLVLSAAIFRADYEPQQVKVVDLARQKIGSDPKKPLHFQDLKHPKRVVYANTVAKANFRIVTVAIHKLDLIGRSKLHEKNRLYFYATKFLLERISWCCRDRFRNDSLQRLPGNGTADLIFSNRRTLSYDDMRDYLRLLRNGDEFYNAGVDWNFINPEQVESKPHEERRGLQIADVVASAFGAAVEPNQHGMTEWRYVQELLGRCYSGPRGRLGYGVKLFPSQAIEVAKEQCPHLCG